MGVGGRVGSVTYRDVAAHTADGRRIARRTVLLRRPDATPAG